MARKADISVEQVITFILVAVAIFLIILLITGIRENIGVIGDTIKSILEALF